MLPWSPEAAEPPPPPPPKIPRLTQGVRLAAIVERLAGGATVTAEDLAHKLEVTTRTVYRDIGALRASGMPVEGTPGDGYRLRVGYLTQPLRFSLDEAEALLIGARLVRAWGAGGLLARAADEAVAKIETDLPRALRRKGGPALAETPPPHLKGLHALLTHAIRARRWVHFRHEANNGCESTCRVKPLSLVFWRELWQVCAWCETQRNFEGFRLERMREVTLGAPFPAVPGHRLEDFLKMLRVEKAWG